MSDIPRYIELQNLTERAKLILSYKQGGLFVIQDSSEKVVISTVNIDAAYGAVVGYLFAKENGRDV